MPAAAGQTRGPAEAGRAGEGGSALVSHLGGLGEGVTHLVCEVSRQQRRRGRRGPGEDGEEGQAEASGRGGDTHHPG